MDFPVRKLEKRELPPLLTEIPDPPKELYVRGELVPRGMKCLAVVGSRNYTNYGKEVIEYLISGLRGAPIAIISGLALGIDGLAHEAALAAGLYTLSVPGSGLDDSVLYPRRNRALAYRILESSGGLLSEFEPTFKATNWSFPARNRIMAGLSHAVLVIEAAEKSGTLITARLTGEYNRELLVVPGSIFSDGSRGSHQFLKLGATPVTSPADILEALNIDANEKQRPSTTGLTEIEVQVLTLLHEPMQRDELIRALSLPTDEASVLLMHMELKGHIQDSGTLIRKTHV